MQTSLEINSLISPIPTVPHYDLFNAYLVQSNDTVSPLVSHFVIRCHARLHKWLVNGNRSLNKVDWSERRRQNEIGCGCGCGWGGQMRVNHKVAHVNFVSTVSTSEHMI